LIEAVRDWDTTGLVEGAEAHTVLFSNCEGMELKVFVQEHFVERQALQHILSKFDVQAVLVTAIPLSAQGEAQQRTGKTFLIVSLPTAIFLVDSHSHHPFKALPSGMLRACVKSTCYSQRAQVLCEWIWDDHGFLMELQCDRQLVDITAFSNKAAVSSEFAACSTGSCSSVLQGGAVPVSGQRAVCWFGRFVCGGRRSFQSRRCSCRPPRTSGCGFAASCCPQPRTECWCSGEP
jgi:hypothetical protein